MKTKLYIGGIEMDLTDEYPIPIELLLTDVKEPTSRRISHSKTITLPNTANNASVFKQLFVIQKDNTVNGFDPNVKVVAFLQNGAANMLTGYFQLMSITTVEGKTMYEGVMYSDEKNLFSQMGDKFISGNTSSTDDVELETGTTQVVVGYSATEYGKTVANNFVASSREGGLFIMDSGTNTTSSSYPYYNVPYQNLRMALKFKHIWDKIFAKYNTTYSSTFINSTFFKSMVYLDTHKTANLTTTQYNNLLASVSLTANTSYATGLNVIVFNNEIQDTGGRYNNGTGVYIANSKRDYTISTNAQIRGRIIFTSAYVSSGTTVNVSITLRCYKNGVATGITAAVIQPINIPVGSYLIGDSIEYNLSSPANYIIPLDTSFDASPTDTIDIRVTSTLLTGGIPATAQTSVLYSSTAIFKPLNNSLSEGDVYNKNTVPASQHKQKDFIIDILRMFNLYLLWDGVNYIIEPRDTFYTLGQTLDWTDKVDRSKDIKIQPVGQLNWKQLQYKFAVDKDFYSDQYNTNYKQAYGSLNVNNNNEFVKDNKTVELKFAPPLSVSEAANYPKLQHIYKLNNGVAEPIDGLPRFGYWAGWVEETSASHSISGIGASNNYDGYLFVGEFNNPTNPTLSVLFGPPREVYYQTFGVLGITTNDTYNIYHKNEIENQVSVNAKIYSAYIMLSPIDINNLRLYDLVVVDGVKFIISKISDYNTTQPQPTMVELIQFIQ